MKNKGKAKHSGNTANKVLQSDEDSGILRASYRYTVVELLISGMSGGVSRSLQQSAIEAKTSQPGSRG